MLDHQREKRQKMENKGTHKNENVQHGIPCALGRRKNTPKDTKRSKTEIKFNKRLKRYTRYHRKQTNTTPGEFFIAKEPAPEVSKDLWVKMIGLDKYCVTSDVRIKLIISKTLTSTTEEKIFDKVMKQNSLVVPETVEQLQQNTLDSKNESKHITSGKRYQEVKKLKKNR